MPVVAVAVKVVLEVLLELEELEVPEVLVTTHKVVVTQDNGLSVMDVTTIVV